MSTESGSTKRAFDELGSGSVSGLSAEQPRENPSDEQESSSKKRKASYKERDVNENELLSALANGENKKNCQFRLEAIFLPKFDNEHRTDQSIRKEIKERVSAGQGFAEVTLKHSGSLLLWSGGQRFYSKNSANNQVTCVGEILLRQHFYRVSSQLDQKKENQDKNTEWLYQKCSDYVEKNRLTLAFEVVTSVLGDHAAVPSRDFLILTAVADRSHRYSRLFYSTSELLELAQEFYLPHNDTWVFRSEESLKLLFDLYDSSRETGMADTTIPALTQASEARIVSIYPHDIFHSNILEGFVIRYVSHQETFKSSRGARVPLDAISEKAKQLLNDISPDLPPCYELVRSGGSQDQLYPILSVNVRDVLAKAREAVRLAVALNDDTVIQTEKQDTSNSTPETAHPTPRSDIPHNIDSSSTAIKGKFEKELRELLRQSGPRTTMQRLGTSLSDDIQSMLPSYCAGLLRAQQQPNGSGNDETNQIAGVIQTLADLGERVQYSIFRERETAAAAGARSKSHSRWLCMVHIYFDKTFQRYRREQRNRTPKGGMMDLFRGFCIELALENDSSDNTQAVDMDTEATEKGSSQGRQENSRRQPSEESMDTVDEDISCKALLLKMKFVPYMVRTFGCRNGIRYIRDGGPDRFIKYARDLLTVHWQVSLEATQTWMPYLQAWGEYVHACLNTSGSAAKKQRLKTLESPPLSEDCYLEHLTHFEAQYFETKADSASQSSFDGLSEPTSLSRQSTSNPVFRGLAIVLALDAASAENATAFIAKEWLHGAKRLEGGTDAINHEDMLLYCTPGIGGRVCCGAVGTEKVRKVRMLPEVDKTYISLILVGLSDDEIKESVSENKDQRRFIGQTNSWRKSKIGAVINLPASFTETNVASSGGQKALEDAKGTIWKISRSIPELDTRPGLLVFFPASIPGCGKSTVVGGDTELKLQETLSDIVRSTSSGSRHQPVMRPRKFSILVGDQQQKRVKFWSMVKEKRLQNSSTVSIADKNVPASSWEKVGQVCASTNGKAVAVIPAGFGVLQTTHVEGARKPDGSFIPEKHHYPFSLHYLAVCMARVMERKAGTHLGKLDKKTAPFAMMIVVKFFSLYRGITAQNFLDSLNEKLSQGGGLTASTPVDLPFFERQNFQELPNDLEQVLLESLKAKRGWDIAKVDTDKNFGEGEYIKELETKLRNVIRKHRKLLFNMTVSESVSRKVFVSQVVQRVLEVEGRKSSSCEFIKIASIDIPRASIHSLLRSHISIETDLLEGRLHRDAFVDGEYRGCEYVKNTHITLAHFTQLSQTQLRAMFASIIGQQVVVHVKGLLWSQRVAALVINVPIKTRGGKDIPRPQNAFQHITIWHKEEVSPSESNDLPQHLASGEAYQIQFPEDLTLTGTLSFWRIDQH